MPEPTKPNASGEGAQGGDDAPKYVTEEQLNKAITGRFKDFEKSFGSKIEQALGTKLETALAGVVTTLEEKLKPPSPQETKESVPAKIEDHPLFKGVLKKQSELEKSLEDERAARRAAEAKEKDAELQTQALAALEQVGFTDAQRARMALVHLRATGRLKWSEDGTQAVLVDSDNTELDLSTGAKAYAKTEEAKIFLPPKGAAGAGSRPGGAGTKPGEKTSAGSLLSQFFDEQ